MFWVLIILVNVGTLILLLFSIEPLAVFSAAIAGACIMAGFFFLREKQPPAR